MFYVDSAQRQKRKGTQLIRRDYSEKTFRAGRCGAVRCGAVRGAAGPGGGEIHRLIAKSGVVGERYNGCPRLEPNAY